MIKVNDAIFELILSTSEVAFATESTCYATVSNVRHENGVKFPTDGKNFTAYSGLCVVLEKPVFIPKSPGFSRPLIVSWRNLPLIRHLFMLKQPVKDHEKRRLSGRLFNSKSNALSCRRNPQLPIQLAHHSAQLADLSFQLGDVGLERRNFADRDIA